MTRISLEVDIRALKRALVGLSAMVLALGYFRETYVALLGLETPLKDLRQIALDTEHCLGSYYSSVLMGIASILMVCIGQREDRRPMARKWYFLALVFVLMSLDESVSFHEVLIMPLRPFFEFSSYLHFAWIVPGAIFTVAMALAYLPFLFLLEAGVRNRIAIAGFVYVAGALGMEAVGGHFHSIGGFEDQSYIFAFLVEETLEIAGLTMFATTLLGLLDRSARYGLASWNDAAGTAVKAPAE